MFLFFNFWTLGLIASWLHSEWSCAVDVPNSASQGKKYATQGACTSFGKTNIILKLFCLNLFEVMDEEGRPRCGLHCSVGQQRHEPPLFFAEKKSASNHCWSCSGHLPLWLIFEDWVGCACPPLHLNQQFNRFWLEECGFLNNEKTFCFAEAENYCVDFQISWWNHTEILIFAVLIQLPSEKFRKEATKMFFDVLCAFHCSDGWGGQTKVWGFLWRWLAHRGMDLHPCLLKFHKEMLKLKWIFASISITFWK